MVIMAPIDVSGDLLQIFPSLSRQQGMLFNVDREPGLPEFPCENSLSLPSSLQIEVSHLFVVPSC